LPGTCIKMVYDVTEKEYAVMLEKLKQNISWSLKELAKRLLEGTRPTAGTENNTVVLFNSLHIDREELFEWERAGEKKTALVKVQGLGCAAYPISVLSTLAAHESGYSVLQDEEIKIDTELLEVRLNNFGQLLSLIDKQTQEYHNPSTMRQVIGKHKNYPAANAIYIHDDVPLYWDAWDLWLYYQETHRELRADPPEIDKKNPYKVTVRYKYKISEESSLTQTVVVYTNSKRIDFITEVDWHETHKILRAYFPLAVRSDFVTCDIQSGNLRRPTVANTSWDVAKYEVCSHKFVDLSEGDYGAALLNDCKYGYSARDNVLGISLLKSSKSPNEVADMGKHTFTYSLYPHQGTDYIERCRKLCGVERGGGVDEAERRTVSGVDFERSDGEKGIAVRQDRQEQRGAGRL
jgi:alpha-mannosidase